MKPTVEIFFDWQTSLWGYVVPEFSIVGTGCRSKEDARLYGHQAIAQRLEADVRENTRILARRIWITQATSAIVTFILVYVIVRLAS